MPLPLVKAPAMVATGVKFDARCCAVAIEVNLAFWLEHRGSAGADLEDLIKDEVWGRSAPSPEKKNFSLEMAYFSEFSGRYFSKIWGYNLH